LKGAIVSFHFPNTVEAKIIGSSLFLTTTFSAKISKATFSTSSLTE
jgi:hypothetical protein